MYESPDSLYRYDEDESCDKRRTLRKTGDTKRGTLIGIDRFGNKYFENLEEELPLRTRWVDYKDSEYDPHAWMSYMVDKAPSEDKLLQRQVRAWEPSKHVPVLTASRSAFKTYNTTKPKYSAWTPVAASR
ncbi:uncharacterized protein RHO25_010959 [Cercospora beticola]|uniref:NADH dehydrogenase [ubiquinone] 1 alpha subcomplex subunit n=1 Tax=Cercospora beticola TaxID=122368 RepID=A0ABZ0P3P6_CERBT|nr:hypothetical protein RHO25_010959 [Cercospora beticola]